MQSKFYFLNLRFFQCLFISSFVALSGLSAVEKKNPPQKKDFVFANIKENFVKDGGSIQGTSLIEKSINISKNESLVAKNEILSLREQLQDIISAESFDEKKYMQIKSKINDVMIKSVQNKDKVMIYLLKDLSSKDRKIMANILKNMFFVNTQ